MKKILEQYNKAFEFIKKDVLRTYCICFIVFISILVFATFMTYYVVGIDGIKNLIKGMHETITDGSNNTDIKKFWYDFFIQNSRANLFVIISGLIPFLFIPVIIMIFNSIVNGFAIGAFALVYKLSFFKSFLVGIAPHGILEYAINILGFALGIILCKQMISGIKTKNIITTMSYYILNSLRVYILIILPILLIAGIIESSITPKVINWII